MKITLHKRVKFAGDVFNKLLELGWDIDAAKAFCDTIPDADIAEQEWISVTKDKPPVETEVMILAMRGTTPVITTGMYEDGSMNTENSNWWWETDGFEYDEELDAWIIPEGWWEYKHYNGDDEHNHAIDDKVTHWKPLPKLPKGDNIDGKST